MRILIASTTSFLLLVFGIDCANSRPVGAEPGVRSISYHPNRRIAEQLLPGDKIVTVVRNESLTVYDGPPETAKAALQRAAASVSSTIAVVHLAQADPSLSDDGTWVITRLRLVVQSVVRLATPHDGLEIGQSIVATMGGGVTTIGNVTVRADPAVVFMPDQRYLLALTERDSAGSRSLIGDVAFAVDQGGRLTPLYPFASRLSGLSLDDVRELIQRRQ